MRLTAAVGAGALALALTGCAGLTPQPPTSSPAPAALRVPSVTTGTFGKPFAVGTLKATVLGAAEWPANEQTLGPDLRGIAVRVRLENGASALTLGPESFQLVEEKSGIRYAAGARSASGDLALPLVVAANGRVEGTLNFSPPRGSYALRIVIPDASGSVVLGRIGPNGSTAEAQAAAAAAAQPSAAPSADPGAATTPASNVTAGSASCVAIVGGDWNPPGDDQRRLVLKNEYVKLKNTCAADVDMTGWSIIDKWRQNRYRFADGYLLRAGSLVRIYSGVGEDVGNALYWNRKGEVWGNQAPEEAYLYDATKHLVSRWTPYAAK